MSSTRWILAAAAFGAIWLAPADAAQPAQNIVERFQLEEHPTPVRELPGWKKPRRILLIGGDPNLPERLKAVAPGVQILKAKNEAEALILARNADAVIGTCAENILAAGKSIKWVQSYAAGVEDCLASPTLIERNLLLTNVQRVLGPAMAEHATALMLALTRGLNAFIPAQVEGAWRPNAAAGRLAVLEGKTLLVVGLGGVGTQIARRGHAFGMRVIATRNSGRSGPDYVDYVGLPDELNKLAAEADVIINAVPLTPQTTEIFDQAFFASMKPTAYFINIGRGKSVVTSALVDALTSGKIAGAALDVVEPEPLPPDHPLWKAPNLVLTPHIAALSDHGFAERMDVVVENTRRYVAGDKLVNVVDLKRGY
jgi:phosphoglycerate dehydrogenase-like enzyme